MQSISSEQPLQPHTADSDEQAISPTGETLSRIAEDGGIELSQRPQDPADEKDEMRRDADAGAGS